MFNKNKRRSRSYSSKPATERSAEHRTPSEGGRVLNLCELKQKSTEELLVTAEELGVVSNGRMLKQEII
ncbi:transcription termination factor Rho, partial [Anaplasma marginale]